MFYSELYQKRYPLRSDTDVLLLSNRERERLMKFIKAYPFRAVEATHRAWKMGIEPPTGHKRKGGWLGLLLPSLGAGDTLVELCQVCNGLASKIENHEQLTADDIETVNLVLYSNKYGKWLSRFLFPTP